MSCRGCPTPVKCAAAQACLDPPAAPVPAPLEVARIDASAKRNCPHCGRPMPRRLYGRFKCINKQCKPVGGIQIG
jgi:hypothetical protein